jgi:hypothetical protein
MQIRYSKHKQCLHFKEEDFKFEMLEEILIARLKSGHQNMSDKHKPYL